MSAHWSPAIIDTVIGCPVDEQSRHNAQPDRRKRTVPGRGRLVPSAEYPVRLLDDGVAARSAVKHVLAGAAFKDVVAGSAVQCVVPGATDEHVGPVATIGTE